MGDDSHFSTFTDVTTTQPRESCHTTIPFASWTQGEITLTRETKMLVNEVTEYTGSSFLSISSDSVWDSVRINSTDQNFSSLHFWFHYHTIHNTITSLHDTVLCCVTLFIFMWYVLLYCIVIWCVVLDFVVLYCSALYFLYSIIWMKIDTPSLWWQEGHSPVHQ